MAVGARIRRSSAGLPRLRRAAPDGCASRVGRGRGAGHRDDRRRRIPRAHLRMRTVRDDRARQTDPHNGEGTMSSEPRTTIVDGRPVSLGDVAPRLGKAMMAMMAVAYPGKVDLVTRELVRIYSGRESH